MELAEVIIEFKGNRNGVFWKKSWNSLLRAEVFQRQGNENIASKAKKEI